jgi:hypothetical protein
MKTWFVRASGVLNGWQQSETGTGGAYAPLSEILPAARVARFVRMTKHARALLHGALFSTRAPSTHARTSARRALQHARAL